MSGHHLPQTLDPFKQIEARVELKGYLDLVKLVGLEGLIASTQCKVDVALRFSKDEQGIANITGTVSSVLSLTCQRCLQDSDFILDTAFNLALVREESDIEDLPSIYEPLVLTEPVLEVYKLVEDEIILALPIVHYHQEACIDSELTQNGEVEEKPNPFAALEALKGK